MNPPEQVHQHAVRLPKNAAIPADGTVPRQACARKVANDSAGAADLKHDENPLWVMATVIAILCGFAAIVIAFI
jgi:hypothetical protein